MREKGLAHEFFASSSPSAPVLKATKWAVVFLNLRGTVTLPKITEWQLLIGSKLNSEKYALMLRSSDNILLLKWNVFLLHEDALFKSF